MGTLTDEDLSALLGEAAESFAVPAPDVALPDDPHRSLLRRRWVQLPVAAAAAAVLGVAAMLVLAGGEEGADRVAEVSASGVPGTDARPAASGVEQLSAQLGDSANSASGGGAVAVDTARSAAVPAPAVPAPAVAGPVPAAPVPDGARVVKTGAIALIVEDGRVTPVLTAVQQLATAAGGVVASAQTQESGDTPSGSVTLRVPVDRFEEVVAEVRSLDAEVRTATTTGKDVTAEYADLEAQLRTLTAARERFLAILAEARTIGDILAVQQRVDDVTARIDRIEGQRQVLAAQSEKATLEVSVTEEDDPAVTEAEKPDDGLSKAFADAWEGFVSGVEALIRWSGPAALVALCGALGYLVLRLAWRASRRRLV
jgi:hypothetical protein